MKKIVQLIFASCFLLFSCEVEKIESSENIEIIPAKTKKAVKKKVPKIIKECAIVNADRCESPGYAFSSFWWPKEGESGPQGLFSVNEDYKMTYVEFDDNTINIQGKTELNGCIVTIDLWLKDKKNLEEWTDTGGLFKDEILSFSCSDVIAELLNYYIVDDTRSTMIASGCNERDGNYTISHRPSNQRYAFQVGPGGALFDSGNDFGVSGWAWAINNNSQEEHIIDFNFITECESNCETAFARDIDGKNCFIDNGFNRWGWSLGPIAEGNYSYEIYAGAGQCDINKGVLIGTVDVNYTNGDVTVIYNIDSSYSVDETHTYAGNEMFPSKNGTSTVAPGQYTITENLTGEIYVIAHAVVCND